MIFRRVNLERQNSSCTPSFGLKMIPVPTTLLTHQDV